ncbi:MAG: PA domain-containing protein [Bacteroidota bacterium]
MHHYNYLRLLILSAALTSAFTLCAQFNITVETSDGTIGPFNAVPFTSFGETDPCDVVSGDFKVAVDETSSTEACNAISEDFTDLVALVDRGSCNFSIKAFNAQQAGAKAIIICQNTADEPFAGGPGDFADQVTIPVFMISRADCAEIRAASGTIVITGPELPDFDTSAEVLWGDDTTEGGFAGGFNGWTTVGLGSDTTVFEWSTTLNIQSPTACDGAVVFDALFYNQAAIDAGPPYPNQSAELISPTIDASNFPRAILSFYQNYERLNGDAFISYSLDDGETWASPILVETDNVRTSEETSIVGTERRLIDIPEIAGQPLVRIKFIFDGDFYFWVIDDVQILEQISINDIATETSDVVNGPLGSLPLSQYDEDNPLVITPGAVVNNLGNNDASNAQVRTSIVYENFEGTEQEVVYQDSFTVETIEIDSSVFVVFDDFQPTPRLGYYEVSYAVSSDSVETDANNNSAEVSFAFTENAISKARWDAANDRPARTNSYTTGGGGDIEFLTGFNFPNGLGFQMDSVVAFVSTNANSLANIFIEAYIYEWNDLNQDGVFNNDELTVAAFAFNIFEGDETATSAWLRMPLLDFEELEETTIPIPEDNKNYILGIRYRGSESVFIGFDEGLDYLPFLNLESSRGEFTDIDRPYLGINAWPDDIIPDVENAFLFTDLWAPVASSIIISKIDTKVEELAEGAFNLELFPNPVSERLQTTLNLEQVSSYLTYQILDVSGKLLFEQGNDSAVKIDQAIFDVSRLPQGQYFLKVITEQGFASQAFVVKK